MLQRKLILATVYDSVYAVQLSRNAPPNILNRVPLHNIGASKGGFKRMDFFYPHSSYM